MKISLAKGVNKVKENPNNVNRKDAVLKMLIDAGFHNQQKPAYRLWKLKESVATLYVRTYEDKLQCMMFGDFDPYIYKTIKFEDVIKRVDCGENIFQILLKDTV